MTNDELPLVLTVEEAAALLGISRGLAYEGCRRGDLPSIRIGRRILVPRGQLLARLRAFPEPPITNEKETT
jgi:excisionase family DNA binding protein